MPAALASNLKRIEQTIERSARRPGRDPGSIRLVAVTKGVSPSRIREAIELGISRFGENRLQEVLPKMAELRGCEWHLIGHLQTNKVKFAVQGFAMIQSLDSIRLAQAMNARLKSELDVLIEVNVAMEAQKAGVMPADLSGLIESVLKSDRLRLKGLMTIAPLSRDPESVRPIFRKLRETRDDLSQRYSLELPELSMGMTDDYPIAIEEGATMLRLGRGVFGQQ
jgi:pyridoxal phosphate enzyme (YggS family)